jgi:hypothetical protein
MASQPGNDIADSLYKPHRRWPFDILSAVVVLALLAGHIALILAQVCPYWTICFPFTLLAPLLWPVVAICLAIVLACRKALSGAGRHWRSVRSILAALLVLFATDTLTGGDYRWFEIAMRGEMRKCGGPEAIQRWAQNALSSPQKIASLEDHDVDPQTLPPEIIAFSSAAAEWPHVPLYLHVGSGGPSFMFARGGWDNGWGIIVGKSDMADPSPVHGPYGGWTKKLRPGVYLFAF